MTMVQRLLTIALVSAALAGCAAGSSSGYQPEKLPAPQAVEGEPEITTRPSVYKDQTYYFQRFADPETYATSPVKMTVAQSYRLFGSRTEPVPAQTIPVRCRIMPSGTVSLRSCGGWPEGTLTDDQANALWAARSYATVTSFPRYRELPSDTADLNRSVDLTLATPEISPATVDLSTGDLVDASLVDVTGLFRRLVNSYPSRALRREIEGDMVIECQIQSDLSVICRSITFTPEEHSGLFDRVVQSSLVNARLAPQLKDGSDARGVRFQRRIAWRIPNK